MKIKKSDARKFAVVVLEPGEELLVQTCAGDEATFKVDKEGKLLTVYDEVDEVMYTKALKPGLPKSMMKTIADMTPEQCAKLATAIEELAEQVRRAKS